MSIQFGSRLFTPRPFTTVLTLALLVMLIALGRWQLHRATEKRALYDSFAAGNDATRPITLDSPPLPRYQHVEAAGHYDETRQVLVDNMSHGERVGYYVVTPFELAGGGWLLVNRGWVPMGASRAELPSIPVPGNDRKIQGRADHLPAPGIQMGVRAVLQPPYPVVANFPNRAEIATLLKESRWTTATDAVLLDAAEPDGYVRDWQPPGFPPMRHIAYAVQWFGLALALFIIYLVTNIRRIGRELPA